MSEDKKINLTVDTSRKSPEHSNIFTLNSPTVIYKNILGKRHKE